MVKSLETICMDEETFNKQYTKQLQQKTLKQLVQNDGLKKSKKSIIFNYSVRIVQIFELSNEFIRHYLNIIELESLLSNTENMFVKPEHCVYNVQDRKIYFINNNYYLDLDSNGYYLKTQSIFQRIHNYIQIAENLKLLHDKGYVYNDMRPQRIRGITFRDLKIVDVLPINKKGDFDCLGFVPTNAPEKNDDSLLTPSNQSQDIFSFGISLAYIELGFENLTKLIGLTTLRKNYIEENYQSQRYFVKELLEKKFVQHKIKKNFITRIFKFFESLFYKLDPLEDCEDFVCLIINCIQYRQFQRPNIDQVLATLHKIQQKEQWDKILQKKELTNKIKRFQSLEDLNINLNVQQKKHGLHNLKNDQKKNNSAFFVQLILLYNLCLLFMNE